MSEPAWMSQAACRGHWKEGGWDDLRPAAQLLVCSTCPVLTQCRADVQHLTAIGCPPSGIVQGGRLHPIRYGHTVIARPKPDNRPEPPFDDTRKTCKNGHPWTRETTRLQFRGSDHWWVCRECERAHTRAYRAGRTLAQQLAIEATS